jgi:NADH:ubiquinone oxidoreductase subunit F (NADH-binding)
MIQRSFKLFLCLSVFAWTDVSRAQTSVLLAPQENKGNEYFVGKLEGKPLVKVHVLSGIKNPGVYHIPINTDLHELLAFAGGAQDEDDLSEVTVRSKVSGGFETKKYDLVQLLKTSKDIPRVNEADVILLPNTAASLSKTQLWVGIFSAVATTALALAVVNSGHKN